MYSAGRAAIGVVSLFLHARHKHCRAASVASESHLDEQRNICWHGSTTVRKGSGSSGGGGGGDMLLSTHPVPVLKKLL